MRIGTATTACWPRAQIRAVVGLVLRCRLVHGQGLASHAWSGHRRGEPSEVHGRHRDAATTGQPPRPTAELPIRPQHGRKRPDLTGQTSTSAGTGTAGTPEPRSQKQMSVRSSTTPPRSSSTVMTASPTTPGRTVQFICVAPRARHSSKTSSTRSASPERSAGFARRIVA
jgi:hypothetical protein